jgi:hypothetical protein
VKNNFVRYGLLAGVAAWCMTLICALAQAQGQTAPKQRPHLDDPNYYDRDAAADAAFRKKFDEEAKAKLDAAKKAALAMPTPHTPDGHPDLSGIWITGGAGLPAIISEDGKTRKVLFGPFPNGKPSADATPPMPPNQPSYKSELQAKVTAGWADVNHQDPDGYSCGDLGVPRMGIPSQIYQVPGAVILLYHQGNAGGIPHNTFRVIYTDGRGHRTDVDPSAMGDSVGHWEGDTLVIDVTRLGDDTWLSSYGTFHSDAIHVVERLTRKAGTLEYTATVEDPNVLTKPWTTTPVTRLLSTSKDDALINDFPCVGVDSEHLVGGNRF